MTPAANVRFVSGFVDSTGGFLIKADTLCMLNDENFWVSPRSNCVTAHQLIPPWILAQPVAYYTRGEPTVVQLTYNEFDALPNGTCRKRRRCPCASLITIP